MRTRLLIVAAILAAGCERPASPLSVASSELAARDAGAPTAPKPEPTPPASHPSPMPPREALSDAAITEKIRIALSADPGLAGADVSINTDHGIVVLAGTVSSHEQSGVASAHAQRQDGVMRVDNQLRLALS